MKSCCDIARWARQSLGSSLRFRDGFSFWFCLALLQYHYFVAADFYDESQGVREQFHSGKKSARNKIAIIRITGVIYDGSGYVKRQIDRVLADPDVKGIVLRVNSPGGTVSGSDYIYHHLQKLLKKRKIPLVVSMGSVAASGGYYVSMVVGDTRKIRFLPSRRARPARSASLFHIGITVS